MIDTTEAAYRLTYQPDGTSITVRENLVDILARELLGPIRGPQEVLPFSPRSQYLVGHLAPVKLTGAALIDDNAVQARAETDAAHAVAIVHTDYVAQVSLLTHLAAAMRTAGRGSLVVFSSVAGIRVRRANYVYGSAKAGLDGFASGLADALHGTGVRLLIARPGFVIGRMTEGMTPAPLSVTPERVAAATARALVNGKRVVWIPWALRPMFVALRLLPRFVWRRMPR